jgi:hypothetical protein
MEDMLLAGSRIPNQIHCALQYLGRWRGMLNFQ